MISKKFLKNSFLYTITGALPIASPIILLPFYSNSLSTANFGYLGLYIGLTQLIQILITFSFDQVITTYYFEYKEDKLKLTKYIGSTVGLIIIIGISLTFLLSIVGPWLFNLIYKDSNMSFYPYGLMTALTAIGTALFKVYTTLLIAKQKAERFFFSNLLNFFLVISISLIGLYVFPHTLIGPMWGRLLAALISFSLALIYLIKEFGFKMDFVFLQRTLSFNLPLFSVGIISWFVANVDRYIINYFMTPSDIGIYEFALRCSIGIEVILGALFNTIVSPIFSIWTKNKAHYSSKEVNRYYNVLTSICILIIALSIFCLPLFIPLIVSSKQYYASFEYIPLLCLGFILQVMWHMYSLPIMYEKKGDIMPKVLVLNCVVKIGLGCILIKFFGLNGAVWALFVTKIVYVLSLVIIGHNLFKLTYNKTKIIILPVVYAIIVIVTNQLLPDQYEIFYHGIEILLVSIVIAIIYKNEIVQLLRSYNVNTLRTKA